MKLPFYSECQTLAGEFNDKASIRPKGSPVNTRLRLDLIKEEVGETIEAIEDQNDVKIIDGLCDVLYVTYGAAHVLGLALDTYRYERQKQTTNVDYKFLDNCISDLRWQLHWIAVDIANQDMKALEKDLTELAIECWEMGFKGLGVDLYPFYQEVHKTNMAKLGGPKRADGKQLKPPGWSPPRIEEMLREVRAGMK
jgi:predicted HAD superfamily Cof-like phosphohydrolase